jgi:hypothetical protein
MHFPAEETTHFPAEKINEALGGTLVPQVGTCVPTTPDQLEFRGRYVDM